jgi:2-octaprenyl-3-methyl-6-methoxy-1,4-benzoquinol hydroxylase/2-octaprenylphenol hydroxylase
MTDRGTPQIEEREVVIVGGGLVGATLAVALARRGIGATVLERHAATPELLRGELVMPRGVAVLDALGLGERLRDVCIETEGTVLHHTAFPGGAIQVDYDLAPPPLEAIHWRPRGLCGWRRPLYETLRAAARATEGVELREGFEVAGVERRRDRLLLQGKDGTRVAARLVVAADGAGSLLRRLMGFEPVRSEQRTFVQGFVGRAPGYARRHVEVGVHAVGAAFVFPFPDGHFRSTIEYPESLRGELRAKDALGRHLEVLKEALPGTWSELGGPKIEALTQVQVQPGQSVELASVVEEGFVLVGDAAGSLDPFTGFGMALGLTDAELLAGVIGAAEGDYTARSLRKFERARHAGIAARREATDLLAYMFLDKSEGFAEPLARRVGERWSDREWILPMVAAQFAGYDAVVEPSAGMRLHFLGLL